MRSKQYYDQLLSNPNVQRGLAVIRATEGTARYRDPYAVAFGGRKFDPSAGHPRQLYSFRTNSGKPQKTSAAGAYQFLSKTWGNVAKALGLKDMSPRNQDIAAVALIDGRNGLKPLVEGDIKTFVKKVGPEWASLPTAPKAYDQPTKSWSFIQDVWDSAPISNNLPEFDMASLPEPATRPEGYAGVQTNRASIFDGLLATSANAGTMPHSNVGLLNQSAEVMPAGPSNGLLATQYAQYQPAQDVQSLDDYIAEQQAKVQANPLSQAPEVAPPPQDTSNDMLLAEQPNAFDARYNPPEAPIGGIDYTQTSPVAQQGLLAQPDLQTTQPVSPSIAANPESMTDAEYQAYQEDLAMAQPLEVPQAPLSATPVTAYVPTAQPMASPFDTAPMAPTGGESFKAPPPPSGNDVWNGQASYGVANGGYELNRQANGDVYRYSPEYDRTDILDASGAYKGQQKGRIEGPIDDGGIKSPSFNMPSFNNPISPAQTGMGNMVRGMAGSVAGGMAGSMLGPAGGLIGSLLGARIAQGKGLLSSQMTPSRKDYADQYGVAANVFPDAPTNPYGSDNGGSSYQSMRDRGFSHDISKMASEGRGGLW